MNIAEIKNRLAKRATDLSAAGFKPTYSDKECWIGRVAFYKEDESIPMDADGTPMLPLTRRTARSLALCATALSLGGAGVAVAAPPAIFVPQTPAQATVSSGGVKFLAAGQTKKLGRAGHFTFSATCSKVDGQNQATFDVTADTVAALDGNAPAPARTLVNIHTNSDALDMKAPGEFDQVGSASSSTSIAKDGQEVDVFYNDGVNWPAMGGAPAHDCFAGYTGFMG